MNSVPLVSICCQTYNHESYIRDAIEGFLIQKTTFPIEILIHDDASTDKTADIVREYEHQYPDLIFPVYQTINQYSKGVPITPTFQYPKAKGKYISYCEGDDYWTDPLKLQKQVDFLEKNQEYGLVHGNSRIFYHKKNKWSNYKNKNRSFESEELNKNSLFNLLIDGKYGIWTATVLLRKELLEKIDKNEKQFLMGDLPTWLDLSQITKFKYFDEVCAVYRISPNSASRPKEKKNRALFRLSMAEVRVFYAKKYNYPVNKQLKARYNNALISYKLIDREYCESYPLIEPTCYEKIKIRNIHTAVLRNIFLLEYEIKRYYKALKLRLKTF